MSKPKPKQESRISELEKQVANLQRQIDAMKARLFPPLARLSGQYD